MGPSVSSDFFPSTTLGQPSVRPSRPPSRIARACAYLAGVSLVGYALALLALSNKLAGDPSFGTTARIWLTATSMTAGAIYLAAMYCSRATVGRRFLAWTLGSALLARAIVCVAPPLLETDFYRYLWDGAVTAQGISPYRYAPESVRQGAITGDSAGTLQALAVSSGEVLPSINHPGLTTIYPPLAQAVFAVAHSIDPFGIGGWRLVLFAFDGLTILLLAHWLRALSLPAHQVAWYVSNPLLLREVYSALHMDVLVLPFLVGAALLATRRRTGWASFLCASGAAIKVWPALLIPYFLHFPRKRRAALIFTGLALVSVPLLLLAWSSAAQETSSGIVAYGETWQNNDGFFRAGIWLTEKVLVWFSVAPWHSHLVMRVACASLLIALVLWSVHSSATTRAGHASGLLLIVGATFILSPTQFPWYWLWMLPLLAARPALPLLLYVVLLPLYHLQDLGTLVYWLEHLPVWGLLAVSGFRMLRSPSFNSRRPGVVHA